MLAVIAMLAAAPALAKEPALGFYVGGGVGQSNFRSDYASQVNHAYEGTGFTVDVANVTDNKDTAW
ncbi:MAG TPA: outer membrane beta-barrel protein, partial [Burkholderiales bacterium]